MGRALTPSKCTGKKLTLPSKCQQEFRPLREVCVCSCVHWSGTMVQDGTGDCEDQGPHAQNECDVCPKIRRAFKTKKSYVRPKKSGYLKYCKRTTPQTFPLNISIKVELITHKCASHFSLGTPWGQEEGKSRLQNTTGNTTGRAAIVLFRTAGNEWQSKDSGQNNHDYFSQY